MWAVELDRPWRALHPLLSWYDDRLGRWRWNWLGDSGGPSDRGRGCRWRRGNDLFGRAGAETGCTGDDGN